jgi:putative endonuclease
MRVRVPPLAPGFAVARQSRAFTRSLSGVAHRAKTDFKNASPGKPHKLNIKGLPEWLETMKYVYLIRSLSSPEQKYIGVTSDVKKRLKKHNAAESPHTSKYIPWELVTFIAFKSGDNAFAFEKYLKSHSGRAFANKRFW